MRKPVLSLALSLCIVCTFLMLPASAIGADEFGKTYTFTYSEISPFRHFRVPPEDKKLWDELIKARKQGMDTEAVVEMTKQRYGLGKEDIEPMLSEMGLPEKLIQYVKDLMLGKEPVMRIIIKGANTAVKGTPQYDDANRVILPAIYKQFEKYKDRLGVKVIMYPGGVIGDEPDFVRKMKLGEIQWAGGTSNMGEMVVPELSVFDLPFLFDYEPDLYYEQNKYCEIDWIYGKVAPRINEFLMRNGFVLFGLMDGGGYQCIAAKKPIIKAEDLGNHTFFTVPQARIGGEINRALGFKKVLVCKIWDLPSITATGMIDSSPCCWYWHVLLQATPHYKYVTNYPIRGFLGAMAIGQKDMFDGLFDLADSPIAPLMGFTKQDALHLTRGMLLIMNQSMKNVMRRNLREKEGKARQVILNSGTYKLSELPKEEIQKIKDKILPLYTELADKEGTYPKSFLDEILKYREEYRTYKKEGKLTDEWYDKGIYPDGYDEWAWTKTYASDLMIPTKE